MSFRLFLIVPAYSDQAGQCRIVTRESDSSMLGRMLANYRENPDDWKDAGIMNSRGSLVCLDAPASVWAEMKLCEPLAAGSQFIYDHFLTR